MNLCPLNIVPATMISSSNCNSKINFSAISLGIIVSND
jgi:hypothetical protein